MEQRKLTGPQAGSLKYDLLTALAATGLHGSPTLQTSMARLGLMITARYNWQRDAVSIGHNELAQLWGVNDRTVKREMKRLTSLGILICIRPGVRGRVGAYRLSYGRVYDITAPVWAKIGSDFVQRMQELVGPRTVVKVDFGQAAKAKPETNETTGRWGQVCRKLRDDHPASYDNWFAKLEHVRSEEDCLVLKAPNRFVAAYIETHLATKLEAAVASEFGQTMKIFVKAES